MAKKRGTTDLSLMVAVDKPSGMTSHDVVNRVRRIFGERRVGHTGTLDPLASGVLPVCIGPATRLDHYLVGHDKSYVVSIVFGAATDTDDAEGAVIRTGEVPDEVFDPFFASAFVASLVGKSKQLPPVYSAIKVGGKKACDEARRGRIIDLTPRDIEVSSAELLGIWGADGTEPPRWDVALETLEDIGLAAALDPLRALGCRFAYLDDAAAARVRNGNPLPARALSLCERRSSDAASELCACTAGVRESCEPLTRDETIALVYDNRVIALYAYRADRDQFASRCVFPIGVIRGYCDL